MRNFDNPNDNFLADLPDLPPELMSKVKKTVVWLTLGKAAYYGIWITAFLAFLGLLIPLPFSPMWGFSTVFVGGLLALVTVKVLNRVE